MIYLARHPVEERGPSENLEKQMDTGLRRYDELSWVGTTPFFWRLSLRSSISRFGTLRRVVADLDRQDYLVRPVTITSDDNNGAISGTP